MDKIKDDKKRCGDCAYFCDDHMTKLLKWITWDFCTKDNDIYADTTSTDAACSSFATVSEYEAEWFKQRQSKQ